MRMRSKIEFGGEDANLHFTFVHFHSIYIFKHVTIKKATQNSGNNNLNSKLLYSFLLNSMNAFFYVIWITSKWVKTMENWLI